MFPTVTHRVDPSPHKAQRIVTVPGLETSPGVLMHDGSLADVTEYIGDGLKASLSLGLHWANAVESQPEAGNGAKAPSVLGLSADGTAVVERVYLAGGALFGQADLRRGGPSGQAPTPAAAVAATTSNSPAARQDFRAVYSRSTRQLFVVGGADPITGTLLGDIWLTNIDQVQWMRVPLNGYSVGKILAATYSPRDRQVWILDEITSGSRTLVRLTRVNPVSGQVEMLGTWPRLRIFDSHWLVIDRDGTVLLAASSQKVNKHVVIRIDNATQPHVDNVYLGQHALALAPLVDGEGYAFTRYVAKHKMPVTIRVKTLNGGHGHWADIGTCL